MSGCDAAASATAPHADVHENTVWGKIPVDEICQRLLGETVVEEMSTDRLVWNPKGLNHTWTLNSRTGLPDIDGLPPDEMIAGFRLFFVNKHSEAITFFEMYEDVPLLAHAKVRSGPGGAHA